MNLPGLVTLKPDQAEELEALARVVGACFLEEMWYATWLDVPGISQKRKLEITREVIRCDYRVSAPYGCVYALPDFTGGANAYLRSELAGTDWAELEEKSGIALAEALTEGEIEVLGPRAEAMEALSDMSWPLAHAGEHDDFIYFPSIGIDPDRRGSGAFGRLFRPFLAYADEHGLRTYLDCYTDRLEQLYGHYGFKVVERKTSPGFNLVERCMIREPQNAA